MIPAFLDRLETLFGWLLETSWQASVLAALVLLLQWALREKLNPRWHHALWLLVVIRLVLPVQPESALSLFRFTPPPPPLVASAMTTPIFTALPPQTPSLPALPATPSQAPSYPLTTFTLLALAWLIGALVFLVVTWWVNRRFVRHVAAAPRVTDPRVLALARAAQQELGIHRTVAIIESAQVHGPAIMGLFRPTLVLPKDVQARFTDDELRFIFLHEFAHLKRGDLFLQWLVAILQVLHWFNPVLWYAFRRMRIDREPATDALVLSRTGEAEKESYGQVLVKLLEHHHTRHALPALVGILEDKDQFKRRFLLITRFTRGAYGWSLLGILLLAALAVGGLTKSHAAEPKTVPTNGTLVQLALILRDNAKSISVGHHRLQILQAFYGADGSWKDVTPVLQKSVKNEAMHISWNQPYTEIGGDPAYLKVKTLIVSYRLGGEDKVTTFAEQNYPVGLEASLSTDTPAPATTTSTQSEPDTSGKPPGEMIRSGAKIVQIDEDDYQAHRQDIDDAVQKGDVAPLAELKSYQVISDPAVLARAGEQAVLEHVRVLKYQIADQKDTEGNFVPDDFKRKNLGVRFVVRPSFAHGKVNFIGDLTVESLITWTKKAQGHPEPVFHLRELQLSEAFTPNQTKGYELPGGAQMEPTDHMFDYMPDQTPDAYKNPWKQRRVFLFLNIKAFHENGTPITATPIDEDPAGTKHDNPTPAKSPGNETKDEDKWMRLQVYAVDIDEKNYQAQREKIDDAAKGGFYLTLEKMPSAHVLARMATYMRFGHGGGVITGPSYPCQLDITCQPEMAKDQISLDGQVTPLSGTWNRDRTPPLLSLNPIPGATYPIHLTLPAQEIQAIDPKGIVEPVESLGKNSKGPRRLYVFLSAWPTATEDVPADYRNPIPSTNQSGSNTTASPEDLKARAIVALVNGKPVYWWPIAYGSPWRNTPDRRPYAIQQAIDDELMIQECASMPKAAAFADEEVQKKLDYDIKGFHGDKAAFVANLEKNGITLEQYTELLRRQELVAWYESTKIYGPATDYVNGKMPKTSTMSEEEKKQRHKFWQDQISARTNQWRDQARSTAKIELVDPSDAPPVPAQGSPHFDTQASPLTSDPPKDVAAIVNGHPITKSELEESWRSSEDNLRTNYHGDELQNQLTAMRKRVLDAVIDRQLIVDEFKAQGRTIPDSYIDDRIRDVVQGEYAGDRNQFLLTLSKHGVSEEKYRKEIEVTTIVGQMRNRTVENKITQYFQDHLDQFPQDEQANVTVIEIKGSKPVPPGHTSDFAHEDDPQAVVARSVQSQMRTGADSPKFEQTDGVDVSLSGKPVWLTENNPFSEVPGWWPFKWEDIRKLQPGQASEVLVQDGKYAPQNGTYQNYHFYYILRVNARRPATITATDVTTAQTKALYKTMWEEAQHEWTASLRSKATIQTFDVALQQDPDATSPMRALPVKEPAVTY